MFSLINFNWSENMQNIQLSVWVETCAANWMFLWSFVYRDCSVFNFQVYSDRYVDQMGIIGYFPATMVKETFKFVKDVVTIPTTVSIILLYLSEIWGEHFHCSCGDRRSAPSHFAFCLFFPHRKWTSSVTKSFQSEPSLPSFLAFSNSGFF